MSENSKKIDRDYVLSDSSVNEYGFRLLTEGYQMAEFQKNPIGYYMHRREDGVALKWDDLRIEGDQVLARPVINLANARGQQTLEEAENGFLNAASVGHIVVLEYSNDPEQMLPGQTGPTITRWYCKECSLVDIPGNCNALTRLYDEQENEINLVDMKNHSMVKQISHIAHSELCQILDLSVHADERQLISTVKVLSHRAITLEQEMITLHGDKQALQQQLQDLISTHRQQEIATLLDNALDEKRITQELKIKLAADYSQNPEGLTLLLKAMPAYCSIVDMIRSKEREKVMLQWTWQDFETNDPNGHKLEELKATHPERYRQIFIEKFEKHP